MCASGYIIVEMLCIDREENTKCKNRCTKVMWVQILSLQPDRMILRRNLLLN